MNKSSRCGGCRHIRRKCTADCIFAPFFPSSDPERFVRVHRVFGAANVDRMLRMVPVDMRAETADSMIYEADCRMMDPAHGCVGVITRLQEKIAATKKAIAETRAMSAIQHGMVPKSDILGFHEEECKQPPGALT